MIPGKELELGGKKLIVAPLTAGACKQYQAEINAVKFGGMPDIDLVSRLALSSLKRNYPEMTAEDVDEMIDRGNYFTGWDAVINLSGLVEQVGELARKMQEKLAMKA